MPHADHAVKAQLSIVGKSHLAFSCSHWSEITNNVTMVCAGEVVNQAAVVWSYLGSCHSMRQRVNHCLTDAILNTHNIIVLRIVCRVFQHSAMLRFSASTMAAESTYIYM